MYFHIISYFIRGRIFLDATSSPPLWDSQAAIDCFRFSILYKFVAGALGVSGGCLESLWEVSGGYLRDVWGCLSGV